MEDGFEMNATCFQVRTIIFQTVSIDMANITQRAQCTQRLLDMTNSKARLTNVFATDTSKRIMHTRQHQKKHKRLVSHGIGVHHRIWPCFGVSDRYHPHLPSNADVFKTGYKFETLSLLDKPWGEATREEIEGREDEVVDNYAQYCSICRTEIGGASMVIGGEVDGGRDVDDPVVNNTDMIQYSVTSLMIHKHRLDGWSSRHPNSQSMSVIAGSSTRNS